MASQRYRKHRIYSDITNRKRILVLVFFTGTAGNKLVTVSCVFPEDTDSFAGNVTAFYKLQSEQIPNPFGNLFIILVALDHFYPFGIGNGNLDFIFLKLKDRNPVFNRGFHIDIAAVVFQHPLLEGKDKIVEGGKEFLLIRRFNAAGRLIVATRKALWTSTLLTAKSGELKYFYYYLCRQLKRRRNGDYYYEY